MIQHKGMRPHDIVVLSQIIISPKDWKGQDLSHKLKLSASEISYSLQRSSIAGLLSPDKKQVMKRTLMEFIQFGLPYIFPAVKGPVVVGVATAYSAPIMKNFLMNDDNIVWPYADGNTRGESIEPLYAKAPQAALSNSELYELMALLDVMRMGRVREKQIALELLTKIFASHA